MEFFFERVLGFLLDAQVDGGGDFESAEFDVLFFEDDFQIAADGVHGIRFAGLAPPCRPHLDGFLFRRVRLLAGDGIGDDHAFERGIALADGGFQRAERIEGIRTADDAGEQGGLREIEFGRVFFEIDAGGLADALDLAAPIDLVDVGFKDRVFFQRGLEADGDGDFQELAVDLAGAVAAVFATFELEDVGDELLGDGGGALAFALGVFGDGAPDAIGIDGAVGVKALVLAGEDRLAEIFGNLAERDDRALFAVDAADFLAEPVVDDRAFGHGMDFRQIVALGAQAVWNGEHHQRIEPGDERIPRGADEQFERQPEPPGEQPE